MKLRINPVTYLSNQPQSWVQCELVRILQPENKVLLAKKKLDMLDDLLVQNSIDVALKWPDPPLVRHSDVLHPIHKMHLLLDMGFDQTDSFMQKIVDKVLSHQDSSGVLLSLLHVPEAYGGSAEPAMGWLTCDYPELILFLLRMGLEENQQVQSVIQFLIQRSQNNGWRCEGSVPKFRGPGRKEDHCPIGTTYALQVFSFFPALYNEPYVHSAIDTITQHWGNTRERKIYMFGMGSGFRKLKYPHHWYDILHVIQALSPYPYAREKKAFQEMIEIVRDKQQSDGSFVPESIYTAYKGWDFCQKKKPSPTLTLSIWKTFLALTNDI